MTPVDEREIARLREELGRLAAENASLRAALTYTPAAGRPVGEERRRRRRIARVAIAGLLVFFVMLVAVFAQLVGREAVRGYQDGWSKAHARGARAAPDAPPPPPAPAPVPTRAPAPPNPDQRR